MKYKIATETGWMLETVLGYLENARHHCIDKLNKPTLEYIEEAIKHLEIANKHLFMGSLSKRQLENYKKLNSPTPQKESEGK